MSNLSPNAERSQYNSLSTPSGSIPPELAERIEKFQTATQGLLAFYEVQPEAPLSTSVSAGLKNATPNNSTKGQAGETRCYYLSPSVLRHERELLKRYHAEDFCDLLAETHVLLIGLVKTMKSVHPDVRLKGYVVSSLGCLLEQASSLILRMRNLYDRVERVGE